MFNARQANTNADKRAVVNLFSTSNQGDAKRARSLLEDRIKKTKALHSEVIRITPAMAEYIINNHNQRNRPVRPNRVAEYATKIKQGRMKLHSQGLSFGVDGNLNNGQHRLRGLIEAGVPCDFYVTFGEDVSAFDVQDTGGTRSSGDALACAGNTNVNVLSAASRLVMMVDRQQWFTNGKSARVDNDEIVAFVAKHPDIIECVGISERVRRKLRCPAPPLAAAFYLIRQKSKHADRLEEFLNLLMVGANLSSVSPILKLRDGLQTKKIGGEYGNNIQRNTTVVGSTVIAWDKWIARQSGSIRWNFKTDFPSVL